MDLQMPVMDGYEANQKIRELGITHDDLRIIALSAYAMDEDRQRVFDAGMDEINGLSPSNPRRCDCSEN